MVKFRGGWQQMKWAPHEPYAPGDELDENYMRRGEWVNERPVRIIYPTLMELMANELRCDPPHPGDARPGQDAEQDKQDRLRKAAEEFQAKQPERDAQVLEFLTRRDRLARGIEAAHRWHEESLMESTPSPAPLSSAF